VRPIADRRVAEAAAPVGRGVMPPGAGDAGEWPLGDLVTDAFRAATGADVALVQPGGLRADLPAGLITWGDLHAALPYGDRLVTMTLTGRELQAALEQAWMDGAGPAGRPEPYLLQVSGLRLTWDGGRPRGERIRIEAVGGAPFDPDRPYLAVMQDALANGIDGFTALRVGREPTLGPLDTDVLSAYLAGRPQPYPPPAGGRLLRAR
jgi:5'-nucleotidase